MKGSRDTLMGGHVTTHGVGVRPTPWTFSGDTLMRHTHTQTHTHTHTHTHLQTARGYELPLG